jgi:carnitine-CoA ligase
VTPLEVLRRYPAHDYSLYGVLASRAQLIPENSFIEFDQTTISYGRALVEVRRAMAWLHATGVGPGDRIAVMSHNHPTTAILLIALAALGATMVGVNPEFGEKEAHYVLAHSQASGIVCSPAAAATVNLLSDRLDKKPWIITNDLLGATWSQTPIGHLPVIGRADEVCLFIYTSGTTGFPKGVMHAQRSIVLAGEGFVRRMHIAPTERLLCLMPMFHANAIFYSLFGTIAAGATILLESKFSASSFWHTVVARRATEVNTIAAMMNILMRRSRDEFVPGHPLKKIYGAPFSPEIYRVFEEEFAVPNVIEGYGMSEIPGACNNPFDGERRKGSMGQVSLHPDSSIKLAELKIVDDEFNALPAGATGEIAVRTPTIMKGYYRDLEATAAAFREGYFLTGDLGFMDAEGYVWFVARKKDIIRRRGENIAGAEIDRVVGDHPEVVEAAAIGVPAELGEEEVLLAVVTKPGSSVTEQAIGQWCRERLAIFKVPRYVVRVDTLPHTPTHRVAKFELRKDRSLLARAVDLTQYP